MRVRTWGLSCVFSWPVCYISIHADLLTSWCTTTCHCMLATQPSLNVVGAGHQIGSDPLGSFLLACLLGAHFMNIILLPFVEFAQALASLLGVHLVQGALCVLITFYLTFDFSFLSLPPSQSLLFHFCFPKISPRSNRTISKRILYSDFYESLLSLATQIPTGSLTSSCQGH